MKIFQYKYSYMSFDEKKRFVRRVIENNLDNSWKPSSGLQTYRDMVSTSLFNGIKWSQFRFNDIHGATVWSLRSPGRSLSGGNKETSDRLQRWVRWIKKIK